MKISLKKFAKSKKGFIFVLSNLKKSKMKASEKLKKGTKVAYKNGQGIWVESVIEKCTTSSVWFKGMGYSSLRKTTFDNYPELYKVIVE